MRGTKEKAKELVDKFINASFNCKECDMPFCDTHCTILNLYEAKQCALIAVNELIKSAPSLIEIERIEHIKYWVNVGEEIEKL
jgi:hypothetical protein